MPNNVAHFAISAHDVERARGFYETAFGWRFAAWGPPGFYLILSGSDAEPGIQGALQAAGEYAPAPGVGGVEITIAVDDVAGTGRAIEAAGGKIVMPAAAIPRVGTLLKFADTEGNVLCAMEYEPGYRSIRYTETRGAFPA